MAARLIPWLAVRLIGEHLLPGGSRFPGRVCRQGGREQRVRAVSLPGTPLLLPLNTRVLVSTALALVGKDGIVFAVEYIVSSKLHEPAPQHRMFTIDSHVGMVRPPCFFFSLTCLLWTVAGHRRTAGRRPLARQHGAQRGARVQEQLRGAHPAQGVCVCECAHRRADKRFSLNRLDTAVERAPLELCP